MSDKNGNSGVDHKESFTSSALFMTLFHEGMDLVTEAAGYLDGPGRAEARQLGRSCNLAYTTESMQLTTRLMQMASWLLVHRAVGEGEMTAEESRSKENRVVVEHPDQSGPLPEDLPEGLRDLSLRARAMQERIARMDEALRDTLAPKPVEGADFATQLDRLTAAFGAPQGSGSDEEA